MRENKHEIHRLTTSSQLRRFSFRSRYFYCYLNLEAKHWRLQYVDVFISIPFFSRLSLKWLVCLLARAWLADWLFVEMPFLMAFSYKKPPVLGQHFRQRFNAIYDVLVLLQFYMERHKQTVFESLRHICYINAPKWVNNNNLMTKCRRTDNKREREK